ncbi:MAG TPA: TlpA disulfide reductase family protein [Candidatus Angelobacter sp.]|nr:TlpA disulfide reductase family protein [Candidatus Angelobacter sp.]
MNRNVIIVLCIVVGITILLFVGKRGSRQPQSNASVSGGQVADTSALTPGAGDPPKGSVAPNFSLKSLPDGKSIELSSLRGKAVLVNFWATYCGPCKIEMPWLDELQKKYGPQGLEILGVAMDDSDEQPIIDFAHKMGVSYPILKGTNKVGDLYGGVDRLPLSYFVDRDGKITHEIVGLVSESDIENAIKEALASGKKEALASSK